ncbi:MAG: hypothetical protein E7400_03690 [Ruminococcaceae bacterium]|nr:hypothetical protein [Oscillospiraceae bacterium]
MPISKNYIEKIKTMNPVTIPAMSYGKLGTPSISIVFNTNGKRLTISKALCARLMIESEATIFPIAEDGVLILAKSLPDDKGIKLSLNGTDKKISYKASVVEFLVNTFCLDYSNVTSKAFTDIAFEKDGDTEYAIIKLSEPIVKDSNDED